jgi:hypothetical protein
MPAGALASLAIALGVSADWLLFGKPSPLDPDKLAKALETHDNIRKVSGDKLSWRDYAELFKKSYEDWNRPDPMSILKDKLAGSGIEMVEVPDGSRDER